MPNPSPQTYDEAIRQGGRALTDEEVGKIAPHRLKAAAPRIAANLIPGNYCNETPCLGGKKYVIYRDDTGGCTRYVEMDC